MALNSYLQIGIYFLVLLLLVKPLGLYMARVYQGESTFLKRLVSPVERVCYRLLGVNPEEEMDWKTYAIALLVFSALKLPGCLSSSAPAGTTPTEPAEIWSNGTRPGVQYRHQLYHQYQLAKLRRRDHPQLSDPDGWSHRAELRLSSCGDGCINGFYPLVGTQADHEIG